ncbi:hypothetical protein CDAR_394261 [Caerostris darwini]|uniref:Uncharacterized protein n=1 Tax=Caerostris darwini TaxID=1538125 RepID=A0AAV4RFA3_9ARAC|nr:hypothetical protein CDAR_394261 [Caerostris darwini]
MFLKTKQKQKMETRGRAEEESATHSIEFLRGACLHARLAAQFQQRLPMGPCRSPSDKTFLFSAEDNRPTFGGDFFSALKTVKGASVRLSRVEKH